MLIFFLSLMIPEMNTGSAEVSILTCNHKKNVHKIKNDPKWAIDWHRGTCSEARSSFYPENYLVSSIKLSLIRMTHALAFCNMRVTSWTQVPESICVCRRSWHKATVTHITLCTEDMSHANPWKCLFWCERLRDVPNEGLQGILSSHYFSWEFISWETLLKCDIPGIHWCMFRW